MPLPSSAASLALVASLAAVPSPWQGSRTASLPATPVQRTATVASSALPRVVELAGVPTVGPPEFTFVQAFNTGEPVRIGVDTHRWPELVGRVVDVYVVAHRTPEQWSHGRELHDLAGGPRPFAPVADSLATNMLQVDAGTLSGSSGTAVVGLAYDVVLDVDRDGRLGAADFVDGWGERGGFYVLPDLDRRGPYGTTVTQRNGGRFKRQQIFFPTEIATLGELPLVVISHGNGHNYQWYDHLGRYLSSWGYVVMSHENNTGPGIQTASESTLRNTNLFLVNLDTIANGALAGHVDVHTIVWIGHSRGGEGVVWAYNQLVNGPPFPTFFAPSDIKLVSSIAPTDFFGTGVSDPLDVPYHLWVGGADADVNGCALSDIAQPFHLHDRAKGERMSISLHGVGHGDFHNAVGTSSVAAGPCLVGRTRTHRIMRGYVLPLLDAVLNDHEHTREYLWRQYESLRGIAPNSSLCIVADLMYQPHPSERRLVVDDFQSNFAPEVSSSGGSVTWDVRGLVEGRLDDRNANFTGDTGDAFNGITLASASDDSRGIVFEFDTLPSSFVSFEVPEPMGDVSDLRFLSFRACQVSRNALTVAERDDLDLSVTLRDRAERSSELRIGAYGGGLEEPYQRRSCGVGNGWTSEWETIRIPLVDFTANGRALDLGAIASVTFRFGSDHGSAQGHVGLDEVEFTAK